jgi:hypothetical protein
MLKWRTLYELRSLHISSSTPICGSWLALIKSIVQSNNDSKRLSSSMYENYLLNNKCVPVSCILCFNKRDKIMSHVDILEKKSIVHIHIIVSETNRVSMQHELILEAPRIVFYNKCKLQNN